MVAARGRFFNGAQSGLDGMIGPSQGLVDEGMVEKI